MDEYKQYEKKPYFYWDGRLHRKLSVNRSEGLLYAWDYGSKRRVALVYSDWKRNKGLALYTNEVAEMFGRNRRWILEYVKDGKIPSPQSAGRRTDRITNTAPLLWSEKDIMNLHDLYSSFTKGWGTRYPKVPSKAEIRAKLHNTTVLYVRLPSGEFVPTWKEQDW